MKALVVDDSAVMREVLIWALAQAGITDVGEAVDGKEAVAATEYEDYDLVLMDWDMPRMLGVDAVIAIRANGKSMPIVMVTTKCEKRRVVEALKAGATNYIIKPFKPAEIVAKINDIMNKD